MPANIEIKARVRDFALFESRATSLSETYPQVIPQADTFFNVPRGRLKLRQLGPEEGQLVFYERPDQAGPKRSNYMVASTSEPGAVKAALAAALGIRGVVRKTRLLFIVGQTRIHLDEVEGLGYFAELEVVLRPGQEDADGQAVAEELMRRLGIEKEDLLEAAYMDMLEEK